MNRIQKKIETKLCTLYLVADETSLHGIHWQDQGLPVARKSSGPALQVVDQAQEQLEEYLAGKRKTFKLPLSAEGTAFQKRVWRELAKIPYGTTCSYGDLAKKIEHENAYRAVGTANGRNPHCIIVPCHRVIAAHGKLGGYGGGLDFKRKLLALEQGLSL